MIRLLQVEFPCVDDPILLMLANNCFWLGEVLHKGDHEFGDISQEGIVGFDILIEALHYKAGQCGLLLCLVDYLLSELDIRTDSYYHVFDEVVAIPESFIFE